VEKRKKKGPEGVRKSLIKRRRGGNHVGKNTWMMSDQEDILIL